MKHLLITLCVPFLISSMAETNESRSLILSESRFTDKSIYSDVVAWCGENCTIEPFDESNDFLKTGVPQQPHAMAINNVVYTLSDPNELNNFEQIHSIIKKHKSDRAFSVLKNYYEHLKAKATATPAEFRMEQALLSFIQSHSSFNKR